MMGEYWKETQRMLQGSPPLISKPKLTDALLQRPPFRFLFDIVAEVQAVTGFAKDLFAGENNDPKAMDKDAKIHYLNRLAAAVRAATGTETDINPAKVVAGLEPEVTNAFLQQLARAALSQPSTTVSQLSQDLSVPPATTHPATPQDITTKPSPRVEATATTATDLTPQTDDSVHPHASTTITQQPPSNPTPTQQQRTLERPASARRPPPKAAFQKAISMKTTAASSTTTLQRPGTASSGIRAAATRVLQQPQASQYGGGNTVDQADEDEDEDDVAPLMGQLMGMGMGAEASGGIEARGALTKNLLEAQQRYQAAALQGGVQGSTHMGSTDSGAAHAVQAVQLADEVQGLSQLIMQVGRCLDRLPEDVEAMMKEYNAWVGERVKDATRLDEELRSMEATIEGAAELARVEALVRHTTDRIEALSQAMNANDVRLYKALMSVAGGPRARDMPTAVPWL